jgi:hypothetical protein
MLLFEKKELILLEIRKKINNNDENHPEVEKAGNDLIIANKQYRK